MFEIEDSLGEESLRQENLYKYEIVEDGTGWQRRTSQCNLEEQFCLSRNGTHPARVNRNCTELYLGSHRGPSRVDYRGMPGEPLRERWPFLPVLTAHQGKIARLWRTLGAVV